MPQKYPDALVTSMLTSFVGVWIEGGMAETADDAAEMITKFATDKPLSLVVE